MVIDNLKIQSHKVTESQTLHLVFYTPPLRAPPPLSTDVC